MNSMVLMALLAAAKLSVYSDDALRAAYPPGCDAKATVCEASGSKVARGLNMLHFRLEQAKQAQSAKKKEACEAEAQSAVAISQGLPKFRQELKASGAWAAGKTYQTLWDGTLSEEAAFAKVSSMGDEAKKLFTACGGKTLNISEVDEMAFKPKINPADAPASIDNRDQRNYDFELGSCPNGNRMRGAVTAMGRANLGSGVENCTLQVAGAGSARLKGGMTCTISGHALLCN